METILKLIFLNLFAFLGVYTQSCGVERNDPRLPYDAVQELEDILLRDTDHRRETFSKNIYLDLESCGNPTRLLTHLQRNRRQISDVQMGRIYAMESQRQMNDYTVLPLKSYKDGKWRSGQTQKTKKDKLKMSCRAVDELQRMTRKRFPRDLKNELGEGRLGNLFNYLTREKVQLAKNQVEQLENSGLVQKKVMEKLKIWAEAQRAAREAESMKFQQHQINELRIIINGHVNEDFSMLTEFQLKQGKVDKFCKVLESKGIQLNDEQMKMISLSGIPAEAKKKIEKWHKSRPRSSSSSSDQMTKLNQAQFRNMCLPKGSVGHAELLLIKRGRLDMCKRRMKKNGVKIQRSRFLQFTNKKKDASRRLPAEVEKMCKEYMRENPRLVIRR